MSTGATTDRSKRRKAGRAGGVPMAALPVRRRRRRRIVVGAALGLLIVLMVLDRHGGPLYRVGEAMTRYDGGRFEVTRVIEGHVLELAVADGESPVTRVRLWGVKPPEDESAEPIAAAARARAAELATGRMVRLALEPHRVRGDFGRVLAYVYLPDGTMLNEALLIEGLMAADDRWSHEHQERFTLLQRQARFDGRGLWRER